MKKRRMSNDNLSTNLKCNNKKFADNMVSFIRPNTRKIGIALGAVALFLSYLFLGIYCLGLPINSLFTQNVLGDRFTLKCDPASYHLYSSILIIPNMPIAFIGPPLSNLFGFSPIEEFFTSVILILAVYYLLVSIIEGILQNWRKK